MTALLRSISRGPVIVIGAAAVLLAVDDLLSSTSPIDRNLLAIVLLLVIAASAVLLVVAPEAAGEYLKTHWRRLALGLSVSIVAGAASLVAAEFATRWIYRDITTTSDDRGYFTDAGSEPRLGSTARASATARSISASRVGSIASRWSAIRSPSAMGFGPTNVSRN